MLEKGNAIIDVKEIGWEEAISLLKSDEVISYISHGSTAQVLGAMLGREIEVRREPLKLKEGDRAVVFQIRKRPREGQVFTEDELREIVESGLYDFYLIEIHY